MNKINWRIVELCFLFGVIYIFADKSGVNAGTSCKNIIKSLKLPPHTKLARNQRNPNVIRIVCDKGYLFDRKKPRTVIRCKNGVIKSPIPPCKGCGLPPDIKNGTRNFTKNSVGSKVRYSCDAGFTLVGRRQRRCGRNLKWSGKIDPYCRRNRCPSPGRLFLRNGNVTSTDPTYSEYATLSFECNEGYELRGEEDIVCRDNRWSGRFPYCRRKRCSNPGRPDNGRRFGRFFYVGSTIEFYCNSGFILYGSRKRTCQDDQTWNGTLTTCDDGRFDCRDPGIPIGSFKTGKTYNIGNMVKYRCKSGFRLEGSNNRTCSIMKSWTGVQPKCVDENYQVFPSLNETIRNLQEGFVDSLLQTTCSGTNVSCPKIDARARALNLKYKAGLDLIFVLDTSSSIKEENFKIAKEFIKEIVKIFGVDTRRNDGTRIACVTYGSRAHVEFNFDYDSVSTKERALRAIDAISYRRGGTATRLALDEVRKTILPSGRSKSGSTTALFLVTDGNSNIGGKPQKAAEVLRDRYKVEIYVIGIGKKIKHRSLKDMASGNGDEEHVFTIKNYKELKKIKKWIAILPKMDFSKCGRVYYTPQDARARIVGGRKSRRKDWPWAVRVSIKGSMSQCGGTLINKEFVLTAAHCFNGLHSPSQIRVFFEDRKNTIRTSLAYYAHPEYNPKTFKNDVGLIKIPKLRRFSRHRQAICLPRGLDTRKLIRVPNKVLAVGWGGTKRVNQWKSTPKEDLSKDLKQVQIPFIDDKECAENVQNKTASGLKNYYFNSTTQFCAADKSGNEDTCHGDSGGPAMVIHRDKNGNFSYYQVGIISWGDGCAQKGEYGYYTKVSSFLDWIDKTIRGW